MKASAQIYNPEWDNTKMEFVASNVTVGITVEGTANLRMYELDQFIIWLKRVRAAHRQQVITRWEKVAPVAPFDSENL